MNEIIGYLLKSVITSTYSLKKRTILIDKPWALIDNDGEIQKLIFKKNNGLILSKNGTVTEGSWEYFPEARALLINRGVDKLLLNEQFIDNNVLILKKDGTDNEFFSLANEITIPDYNIPKYLNSLKCKKLKIYEQKLLNGKLIQIHDGHTISDLGSYRGKFVELLDSKLNTYDIIDGSYISDSKLYTIYVNDKHITEVERNVLLELANNHTIEIENGTSMGRYGNLKKKVTQNGNLIADSRIIDKDGFVYVIQESRIIKILFTKDYQLKNGNWIEVEQQDFETISRGDKITTLPQKGRLVDGSYKIKGKFFKIQVKDSIVV
ncbi:hypothetical protein [uncultured Draconibacterium sp.]|uniref:hypothetical protein n=1 Tax=uncultured Draconibacterium sp. TaxID=1573823 RepID=UPI0032164A37